MLESATCPPGAPICLAQHRRHALAPDTPSGLLARPPPPLPPQTTPAPPYASCSRRTPPTPTDATPSAATHAAAHHPPPPMDPRRAAPAAGVETPVRRCTRGCSHSRGRGRGENGLAGQMFCCKSQQVRPQRATLAASRCSLDHGACVHTPPSPEHGENGLVHLLGRRRRDGSAVTWIVAQKNEWSGQLLPTLRELRHETSACLKHHSSPTPD